MVAPQSTTPTPTDGPLTRARAKLQQDKVNSLLSMCDLNSPLDGVLLSASTLCTLRYEATEATPCERGREDEAEEPLDGLAGTTAASAGTTARALLAAVLPPPLPPLYRYNSSNSRHRRTKATACHRYYRLGETGTTGAPLLRPGTTAATTGPLPNAIANSLPPYQYCLARTRYYRSGDTGTTGCVESASAPPASED